jgi:LmbE family N-acetylglucosaminyl deacetylase
MKFLNKNHAMCLCPHPDDTALSMSGLVKKYNDTMFHMLYLSTGTATDQTSGPNRFGEDILFWKLLGVENVQLHFIDGCTFDSTPISSWITVLEKEFVSDTDLIFSPSNIDSHYEHQITNSFLYPLSRSKPLTLVEYRSVSTLREWIPNLFVSMDDEILNEKISCLQRAFTSQMDSIYFQTNELTQFHEDFINKKRSHQYCEMYKILQYYDQ